MILGAAMATLGLDNSGFMAGIASSQGALSGFGAGGSIIGGVGIAFAAVGVAAVAMGVVAVKAAGDFQAGMTSLVTGAGEAESSIGLVSQGILAMSVATGTSTQDLTAGMYMIESAGFHGAAGLAVLQAAAEGAKVGAASLADVANGVTTAMVDYSSSGLTAAAATNTLIAAVSLGKTHMGELAASMSTILPTAAAVGVSFTDVAAAMATMTGEGTSAASAATYLRQLLMALEAPSKAGAAALASIGLTTGQVAAAMKVSLPGALQMITDDLAKKFPVGSAAYIAALKAIAGGSKQMQGILELTGTHLTTFKSNVDAITAAVTKGGGSITGWNLVQQDFNFKMSQAVAAVGAFFIILGTKLLPILTPLVGNIAKGVAAFTSWALSGQGLHDVMGALAPIIAYLGPIFHDLGSAVGNLVAVIAPLIVSFGQWLVSSGVLRGIVVGIVVAVGLFVQGLTFLVNVITAVVTFFSTAGSNAKGLWNILMAIGAFLASVFVPVWQQLVTTFQTQLVPAWNQMVAALAPAMPLFKLIGAIILGIVVVSLGILIAILAGVIAGLGTLISAIIRIFGGIVQVISGAVQVIGGILSFLVDLCTGHFDKLGSDLGLIWNGIVTMFKGVWQIIVGIFQGTIGVIISVVAGFIQGIIGFFTMLWHTLVGGSIIPDMVNGIIKWFATLISTVIGAITGFVSNIIAFFTRLWGEAQILWDRGVAYVEFLVASWIARIQAAISTWINNFITNFTNLWNEIRILWDSGVAYVEFLVASWVARIQSTIQGWISTVQTAITNVWNWIKTAFTTGVTTVQNTITGWGSWLANFFGNLASNALQWGKNLIQGLINGIASMISNLEGALGNVAGDVAKFLGFGSPTKLGPGREADKWAPAFINMFAAGLEAGIPQIESVVSRLAQPIAVNMGASGSSGPMTGGTSPTTSSSRGGGSREIHIHQHWNGREISHAIVNDMGEALVQHIRLQTGALR